MAFMTVRLNPPGVKVVQTKTLIPASIAESQNIRWREGLPEKLGGWMRVFPPSMDYPGVCRELWTWADLNFTQHMALAGDFGVCVHSNVNDTWSIATIAPLFNQTTPAINFTATAGSNLVAIVDPGSNANIYESITLLSPVSLGGSVIWPGSYPIVSVQSPDEYTIQIPYAATINDSPGTVPYFTASQGTSDVNVLLTNHGLLVGQYLPIAVPTVVPPAGPITLSGFYQVLAVIDANNITIGEPYIAPTSGSAYYGNLGGAPTIYHWVVMGQQPPGGGWGLGPYGGFIDGSGNVTSWGQGAPSPIPTGSPVTPENGDWVMDNWGSEIIINPQGSSLFHWNPTTGISTAQQIWGAPDKLTGFFIAMPQQQIVAYGASVKGVQDPMQVAWCDNANYNVWTAAVTNQAGTYRLTRGSQIVGGLQGPQQAMLWTDVGVWLMQYIGYPDVWGFGEIARGCGLISKKAAGVLGNQVFWMGYAGFWAYANGAVQPIQCDVWDVVMKNLVMPSGSFASDSRQQLFDHIRCATNTEYNEVAWHFPSMASPDGENDMFVKLNVLEGTWDYGTTTPNGRVTEWTDKAILFNNPNPAVPAAAGPFSSMISQNVSGTRVSTIMLHEHNNDADTLPLGYSLRTGFFSLTEGEDFAFIDYCIPDAKFKRFGRPASATAQVQATFYVQDFPENDDDGAISVGPALAAGTFTLNSGSTALDLRCRGRYFSFEISGNDMGSFFRLGGFRFRFAPDGRNS